MKHFLSIVGLSVLLGFSATANHGCANEVSYPRRELDFPRPREEVRAVWVTRWDYRTEADIRTVASNCARLGLNRIYFQVRGQADAFYRSAVEPWGQELGGDPGFDPLAVAIESCHERDIKLFAWINVLPAWKGAKPPKDKRHLVHTHPEWFLMDQNGRRTLLDRERYVLLNPCLPEVREHLVSVVEEIAARYDVDGVQFDYIRFLSRDIKKGEDVPYDQKTLDLFREHTGESTPAGSSQAWDRFRRDAINRLVRDMSRAIRTARPEAIVSMAAVGNIDRARDHLFQDAAQWFHRGWVDEVCPMLYSKTRSAFRKDLDSFTDVLPSAATIAGVGIYKADADVARGQLKLARRLQTSGYAVFGYTSLFLSRSPLSSVAPEAAERRAKMRKLMSQLGQSARELSD